jgi:hypothetical protein
MKRVAVYHLGMDCDGGRHKRMRPVGAMCRHRQQVVLMPKVAASGLSVWRNGFHQKRWELLVVQCRADRRSFLTTLRRPPLVSPVLPRF